MDEQVYMVDGDEMVIKHKVEGEDDLVVMLNRDGYGDYRVMNKSRLVKKEDSYEFKRAKERADELRLYTAKVQENLTELAEQVVDKALTSLSSRIKFNVAFGKGGHANAYALMLGEELEKMIRASGDKIAKKEKLDL